MRSLTLSSILKDLLNSMKLALDSIKNHTAAIASQEEVVTKLQNYQNDIDKKLEDAKTQAATALNQHNSSTSAHQDIRNQMATLNQKYTDDMVALRQDLSTVYHYKSSVNSYNDLPKSGMKVGDTYNIQTKDDMHGIRPGDNVSWNGTDWDNLSGIVDLSRLLPKSGGVITGDLSVQGKLHANADTATKVTATAPADGSTDLVYGTMAGTDAARIHISGANDKGELEIATSDNADETIVVRQYYHGGAGTFTDVAREAYILNSEGNTSFPRTVTAPRFSGVLNGNAATASKLATPRTITLAGGVTGSTTFDGSSNVTINATITQSANAATADAAATIKNFEQGTANAFRNVWFSDNTNNAKPVYNESIQYNPSTNVLKAGTFQGALNGNADTATDVDKLDGYHENAFLRAREDASSNQENTLWDQIGIKQYAKKLPDGLTDVYNFGAVVSLPSSQSRLDLWYADHDSQGLAYRTGWANSKRAWKRILDSTSFNEFAPKLDGTGAKGTWGINISGTSERSNHINTQEVGHTDNTERRVFVSGSGDNTIQCYDPSMTYNSATQTLTVKAINGTAAKATQDADGNAIADTYLKKSGGTMTGEIIFSDEKGIASANGNAFIAFFDDSQAGIVIGTNDGAPIYFSGDRPLSYIDTSAGAFHGDVVGTATKAEQDASGNVIADTYATKTELSGKQDKLIFDTNPTANSTNPVTSDGIKKAIDAKTVDLSGYQTKLTFDSTPTVNSTNPVTSGGVKTYVDNALASLIDGDTKSY